MNDELQDELTTNTASNITISLCMIVRQEEEALGKLLQSVKDLVDEINI
ncbi:hypothetical protein [Paenibacillus dakarensis]|nr:hypothetical protein [Paenibacillus dakarensis]